MKNRHVVREGREKVVRWCAMMYGLWVQRRMKGRRRRVWGLGDGTGGGGAVGGRGGVVVAVRGLGRVAVQRRRLAGPVVKGRRREKAAATPMRTRLR